MKGQRRQQLRATGKMEQTRPRVLAALEKRKTRRGEEQETEVLQTTKAAAGHFEGQGRRYPAWGEHRIPEYAGDQKRWLVIELLAHCSSH